MNDLITDLENILTDLTITKDLNGIAESEFDVNEPCADEAITVYKRVATLTRVIADRLGHSLKDLKVVYTHLDNGDYKEKAE